MNKEIHILFVEDVPADVVAVNHELRKAGLAFRSKRVETREAFLHELEHEPPDLILSDHCLPSFDGFTALSIAQDRCPNVPFIFVTGSMGEEMTIETFESGATDYVLKRNLSKLPAAVERALREAEERNALQEKEQQLRESEERFRMLVEGVRDYAIFMLNTEGRVTSWNTGAQWIHSYRAEEVTHQHFSMFYTPEDRQQHRPEIALETAAAEGRFEEEGQRVGKGGKRFWANVVITALRSSKGKLRGFAQVTQDITQRKQAEEALRNSESLKTAILDTALDAIISIDHAGLVQEWNPAAQKIFGYRREEVMGRPVDELIVPSSLRKIYHDGLAHYLMTGVGSLLGRPVELTLRRANGSEFRAELAISRVPTEDPPRCTALIRDITERRKAEQEIHRLNEELEQRVIQRTTQLEATNKELEAFSYSVSHDLRAPLDHITAYTKILQDEAAANLPESSRQHLQTIADSARQLSHLIDALLAFSQMSCADVHQQRFSLAALLEEARHELRRAIEDRKIVWQIGPLPEVQGDPVMLRQVLVNLLANALKYSRTRAKPIIQIGATETEQETVFFIRDNGVGFDMKDVDKLFGVFQRLHPSTEFEGIGIGLANVMRIVRRHGGRAWAEGSVDGGATFYFSLPKLPRS